MNVQQGRYLVGESFRTLRRHKGIMTLSILIMSLTLLVLAVFLLITENMINVVDRARDELDVYVYIDDGVPPYLVEQRHRALLAMPQIEEIHYISKDQALEEFRNELGEEADLLEALETNPLPASFRVRLKAPYRNPEDLAQFARTVSAMDGVEEVSYGAEFFERFSFFARVLLYVDVFLGIIVVLSAIFVISNTVRLTILTRRKTIEILKLVGATNLFIRTPFMIEGAVQGGLAALVSLSLLFAVHLVARNMLPDLTFLSGQTIALYVVVCTLLGSFGSFASLRRFLRL